MAEKKLSPSERAALIEKAFARLPGAKDDDDATAKQRFRADRDSARPDVCDMIDKGVVVEFEPRDGFYCVRTEFDGVTRRFTGQSAREAIERASGAAK